MLHSSVTQPVHLVSHEANKVLFHFLAGIPSIISFTFLNTSSTIFKWKPFLGCKIGQINTGSFQCWRLHNALASNAAINGHLELTLLKGRQRFDAISTSNLEVYKFRDWWIFTYFIFGHGESSPNNIWSMANLERMCVLLFYYFLYLKLNFALEKNKSAWWIFTQLYFCGGESWSNYFRKEVNPDLAMLLKRWTEVKTWGR